MDVKELTSQGGCYMLHRYTKEEKFFFKEMAIDNIAEMD